jgi:hypothetical protein
MISTPGYLQRRLVCFCISNRATCAADICRSALVGGHGTAACQFLLGKAFEARLPSWTVMSTNYAVLHRIAAQADM